MSCHVLWIGPRLGAVERACLRSVLRQGHTLTLWCYAAVEDVPEGVTIADAARIVPPDRIVTHRGGSPALFSNLFRYELLRRGLGVWLDCDVYLLKPLDLTSPYLLGEEAPGQINSGVMRVPAESPLLPALIALFDGQTVPDWLPARARLAARVRRLLTGRIDLGRLPWGWSGPRAVTALAARLDLPLEPLPPEIFYPSPWQDAAWIFDPVQRLEDWITPRTIAVHLWNERIRDRKDAPAPPGSFLARLQREGA